MKVVQTFVKRCTVCTLLMLDAYRGSPVHFSCKVYVSTFLMQNAHLAHFSYRIFELRTSGEKCMPYILLVQHMCKIEHVQN